MAHSWQQINAECHSCHSWLIVDESRLTAMTTDIAIIAIVSIAVLLVLAEVLREVFADRPTSQPRSHFEDPQFRSPGAWS